MEKPVTVEDIRAKYPNPQKSADLQVGYCVGGALCQYVGMNLRYPICGLDTALRRSNPSLSAARAAVWRRRIISANDRCDFESAWQALGRALVEVGEREG